MGIRNKELRTPVTMVDDQIHTPVMLERTIELLAPAVSHSGAVLVDATLGMGGHAEALLQRFPQLVLVGLDRDTDALAIAGERLARFGERVHLVHTVYDSFEESLDELGIPEVSGILFDLGVSSLQLDRVERGFSYSKDAPLDMRMDATSPLTAERILADYSETELRRIFWEFGEERLAQRYAKKIVESREAKPLVRSAELVELITAATPVAVQRNQELSVLEHAIPAAIRSLAVDGRIVVLAYQSLEDRIVKRALAAASSSTAPAGLPIELPEHRAELRLLVRGAELASDGAKAATPRSTPVRLRAATRIRRAA
jgi:16S rRNA (cytosine1402-N4)-methyltransferase